MLANSNRQYHPVGNVFNTKKKFFRKYSQFMRTKQNQPLVDLRLIVVRHGERVDTQYGSDWYTKIFADVPVATSAMFHDQRLPQRLPQRALTCFYMLDPPISRTGQNKAFIKGQQLSQSINRVDYCYSSPASRCVLTAEAILRGMNHQKVPLRLEPSLFEPMGWNSGLQMAANEPPFMSTTDWLRAGYNINTRYPRLISEIDRYETEHGFYNRNGDFFNYVEAHHAHSSGHPSGKTITILIVAHAASPVIYPMIAMGQPLDEQKLAQQCPKIPFLRAIILDRNAVNGHWNTRAIVDQP